jgi:hypothetical protein
MRDFVPVRKSGEEELPLPLLATKSPAAHRERSSDDIHVGWRVRASASSWMRARSYAAGDARPDLFMHLQLHASRQSILQYPRGERGRIELPEHWTQQ